ARQGLPPATPSCLPRGVGVALECGWVPVTVAAVEFIHLAGAVDQTALAGPKRVRIRCDFNDDERVDMQPIRRLPLDGARTRDSRSSQEHRAGGGVLKNAGMGIGVNAGFHLRSPFWVWWAGASSASSASYAQGSSCQSPNGSSAWIQSG